MAASQKGARSRPMLVVATVCFVIAIAAFIVAGFAFARAFGGYEEKPTPSATSPIASASPTAVPTEVAQSSQAAVPSKSAAPRPSGVAIPLKAPPVRLVVPAAKIDTPVSPLPMTKDQIATREYVVPQTTQGYAVRFTDGGYDYFDDPGRDTTSGTWILGHSCAALPVCSQFDWQFTRLSDPKLVHVGTDMFVTTSKGKVCYRATKVSQLKADDIPGQDKILGRAIAQHELVLTTCYPPDIHGENTFVQAAMRTCSS